MQIKRLCQICVLTTAVVEAAAAAAAAAADRGQITATTPHEP
jgi:ABC-type transporter Mla maintaining outer membrane lipid asymmetry permease subunit MlaE